MMIDTLKLLPNYISFSLCNVGVLFVVCLSVFLQRVSIACYAKRCISHRKSVRLTV